MRPLNPTSDRRDELTIQLNSARRAVGTARLAADPAAEAMARARLHSAKVALGEPGETWWEHGA